MLNEIANAPAEFHALLSATEWSDPETQVFKDVLANMSDEEFDALVDEAKATVDKDAAAELYRESERVLLNGQTMAIPMNWYKGSYAFDEERVTNFPTTNNGLIIWEQITLAE